MNLSSRIPKSWFKFTAVSCVALAAALVGGRVADAGEAFGGGVALVPDLGLIEHFAFNAEETGDDMAKGRIKLEQHQDGKLAVLSILRVDCMLFLDENTVIVSGTVTFDFEPEYIGTTAVFTVRDNGEGTNSPPDEFTGVFYSLDFGIEWDCEVAKQFLDDNPGLLEELLTPFGPGNIQVRP